MDGVSTPCQSGPRQQEVAPHCPGGSELKLHRLMHINVINRTHTHTNTHTNIYIYIYIYIYYNNADCH